MNAKDLENQEYFSAVQKFTKFIQKNESMYWGNGLPATWYRGQAKNWSLEPGILRDHVFDSLNKKPVKFPNGKIYHLLNLERLLLTSFKREGYVMNDRSLSNKEWYYAAQHYGLPTRLMDWSSSPRIALWFAVQGHDDEDGYIYTIQASDYVHNKNMAVIKKLEKEFYDYILGDELSDNCTPKWNGEIYAVFPEIYNNRQARQNSLFTLHLPNLSSPEEYMTSISSIVSLETLIIPKAHKPLLRAFLSAEGMRRWHLFPDMDNLAKGLVEETIC